MRKRYLLGTGLSATALVIGLAAPSLATTATTWTVKPGGNFSASSGRVMITDTAPRLNVFCSSSSISGKLKSGSGLAGANIASITAWSLSQCSDPTGTLSLFVTFGLFPYHLNAQSYDAARGETTAHLVGIVGSMSGFCTLRIAGTSATTPGQVEAVYTNSTHKLVISSGTLHYYSAGVPNRCAGLLNIGDRITISATYMVTPAQTTTSP